MLLTTLPEFDHYDRKIQLTDYLGIWDSKRSLEKIVWRNSGKPRAVAYLKPFQYMPHLLQALEMAGVECALVGDGMNHQAIPANCEDVVMQAGHIDFQDCANDCVFAITNGNHGSTLRLLSLGIPVMAVPLFIEQRLTGHALVEHGLGVMVHPSQPQNFLPQLLRLNEDGSYAIRARAFAEKYREHLADAEDRAFRRLMELLS